MVLHKRRPIMKSLTVSHTLPACLIYVFSLTASAAEIHVTRDSPGIQAAIEAAADGDEIIVAPGVYQEHINFLGKAVTVRSTDPDDWDVVAATIIDGTGTGRCVTFTGPDTGASLLAGVTITNGYTPGLGWDARGGGIYCEDSSPMIANNVITGNVAGVGAGVHCTRSSARIIGNTITANSASLHGGGIGAWGTALTIADNIIAANSTGDGGGAISAWSEGGVCVIIGNTMLDNTAPGGGGAIGAYGGPTAMIIAENTISGNLSGMGTGIGCSFVSPAILHNNIVGNRGYGISLAFSHPHIINNLIAGNDWSGIFCGSDSSAVIANNTIVANDRALVQQSAHRSLTTLVINCILWANRYYQVDAYSTLLITHSAVQGGVDGVDPQGHFDSSLVWGEGNIEADPQFVDPGHWDDNGTPDDYDDDFFVMGDYHLLPGSPCIDAGTNDIDDPETEGVEELPETDFDGLPRIIDGDGNGTLIVDIGAYEHLRGDVNYDGKLNVLDLLHVRNSLGKDPASDPAARRADVNADGKVDTMDLIAVRNLLSKW
jgi:hypothetical protein